MVQILDCTLRDGSYVINFGFTTEDTMAISQRLHELGIPYIEVGHGVGLGASEKGYGVAAATDLEYMRAARGNWGMFCIPGIGTLDDIHMLADQGAGFVRIGCNVEDATAAGPYIEFAREKGLEVFCNLMKSYSVSCAVFREAAKHCLANGAHGIYVVDSAGGMESGDVWDYVSSIKHDVAFHGAKIGFHGHNNLGLANANAMECTLSIDVNIVDTTLQGIGRSGGNVSTEQFIAIMKNHGEFPEYDLVDFLRAGDDLVSPIVSGGRTSSLDVMAGYTEFHSSYMPRLLDVAARRHVDPFRLMELVTQHDKVNCPLDLLEQCAAELPQKSVRIPVNKYFGDEQR